MVLERVNPKNSGHLSSSDSESSSGECSTCTLAQSSTSHPHLLVKDVGRSCDDDLNTYMHLTWCHVLLTIVAVDGGPLPVFPDGFGEPTDVFKTLKCKVNVHDLRTWCQANAIPAGSRATRKADVLEEMRKAFEKRGGVRELAQDDEPLVHAVAVEGDLSVLCVPPDVPDGIPNVPAVQHGKRRGGPLEPPAPLGARAFKASRTAHGMQVGGGGSFDATAEVVGTHDYNADAEVTVPTGKAKAKQAVGASARNKKAARDPNTARARSDHEMADAEMAHDDPESLRTDPDAGAHAAAAQGSTPIIGMPGLPAPPVPPPPVGRIATLESVSALLAADHAGAEAVKVAADAAKAVADAAKATKNAAARAKRAEDKAKDIALNAARAAKDRVQSEEYARIFAQQKVDALAAGFTADEDGVEAHDVYVRENPGADASNNDDVPHLVHPPHDDDDEYPPIDAAQAEADVFYGWNDDNDDDFADDEDGCAKTREKR